jgi:hypothetical protein
VAEGGTEIDLAGGVAGELWYTMMAGAGGEGAPAPYTQDLVERRPGERAEVAGCADRDHDVVFVLMLVYNALPQGLMGGSA